MILWTHTISTSLNLLCLAVRSSPNATLCTLLLDLWMLLNAFQAIVARWGFRLNDYVTCILCRKHIDLVEFGVNSFPKRNNVICLWVIPKGTESETIYQITWDDFCAAAALMCTYTHLGKPGCECCEMVVEVLCEDNVKKYIHSWKFCNGQPPVETAINDNFKG